MAILSSNDVQTIIEAMLSVLKKGGISLEQYVRAEAAKFALSIETIGSLYESGAIGQEEAVAQFSLSKNASEVVLTSVEGIGGILARQAINAGLQAVGAIANRAIGFTLI